DQTIRSAALSCLLKLDQGSAEILRMQEQHGLIMGAETRLPIAEDPGSLAAKPIARSDDVIDFIAQMVHAACRIAFEKGAHRRSVAERLEQLDPRIRQIDKDHRDTMVRQCLRPRDAGA